MVVIMISPLIWGYKYGELGKGNGCWEVPKEIESKERESEPESKEEEGGQRIEREKWSHWVTLPRTT